MTSEEFRDLVEENTEDSGQGDNDSPLTLDQLAQLERQKGIKFPDTYKEFLSTYGVGDPSTLHSSFLFRW
jgi:hypothetical protein